MEGENPGKGKAFIIQASVLKRIIAFIVDLLVINLIILLPFIRIFKSAVPDVSSFSEIIDLSRNIGYSASFSAVIFTIAALHMLYFVVFEKKLGQSIGKMLFGLYVKGQAKDLKNWQLIVRSIFFIVPDPVKLIDFVFMLFTRENQRLLEKLSMTKVVEKYKI